MTRLRRAVAPAVIAALAGVAAVVGVPMAHGSLTSGLNNTTDTVASNAYSTCTAAARGENATNRAFFTLPFADTVALIGATTATDVSGNGRNGTYTPYGVTYSVTSTVCPRDNTKVVTLDGTTASIYDNTLIASPGPQTFSVEIWFKTANQRGGKLIGYGSSTTGASGSYDRHLYIDSNGKLVFGVYDGGTRVVTSTARVDDGTWHQAIGTFTGTTLALYLDGQSVGGTATALYAQKFAGYWRIGYDNLNSWPNPPTSYYFAGNLAFASVYSYALAPDQVQSHYLAGR